MSKGIQYLFKKNKIEVINGFGKIDQQVKSKSMEIRVEGNIFGQLQL